MSTDASLADLMGLLTGDSLYPVMDAGLRSESRYWTEVSIGGKFGDGFLTGYTGVDEVKSRGSVLLVLASMRSSGSSTKISGTGRPGGDASREFRRRLTACLNLRDQCSVSKKPTTVFRRIVSSTRCNLALRRRNSSSLKLRESTITL